MATALRAFCGVNGSGALRLPPEPHRREPGAEYNRQKDTQAITSLCRQLYSHTFFARYNYQKPEKIVRLTLQTAPVVRQFFDGGWLEWYAFIEQISQTANLGQAFSCARGVKVVFPNEDLHELDVVCLPAGQPPIIIECKSGEFRRDIDKYLRLRKRLGLNRSRFIICAADLSLEQAQGLAHVRADVCQPANTGAALGPAVRPRWLKAARASCRPVASVFSAPRHGSPRLAATRSHSL